MVNNFQNQVVEGASEGNRGGGLLGVLTAKVQTSTLLYNFLEIGFMAAFFHTGALDLWEKEALNH